MSFIPVILRGSLNSATCNAVVLPLSLAELSVSITFTEIAAFSFVSCQNSSFIAISISYFPAVFGAVIVHL